LFSKTFAGMFETLWPEVPDVLMRGGVVGKLNSRGIVEVRHLSVNPQAAQLLWHPVGEPDKAAAVHLRDITSIHAEVPAGLLDLCIVDGALPSVNLTGQVAQLEAQNALALKCVRQGRQKKMVVFFATSLQCEEWRQALLQVTAERTSPASENVSVAQVPREAKGLERQSSTVSSENAMGRIRMLRDLVIPELELELVAGDVLPVLQRRGEEFECVCECQDGTIVCLVPGKFAEWVGQARTASPVAQAVRRPGAQVRPKRAAQPAVPGNKWRPAASLGPGRRTAPVVEARAPMSARSPNVPDPARRRNAPGSGRSASPKCTATPAPARPGARAPGLGCGEHFASSPSLRQRCGSSLGSRIAPRGSRHIGSQTERQSGTEQKMMALQLELAQAREQLANRDREIDRLRRADREPRAQHDAEAHREIQELRLRSARLRAFVAASPGMTTTKLRDLEEGRVLLRTPRTPREDAMPTRNRVQSLRSIFEVDERRSLTRSPSYSRRPSLELLAPQ